MTRRENPKATPEELARAAAQPGARPHRCVVCNTLTFVWHPEWSAGTYTCPNDCSKLVFEHHDEEERQRIKVVRDHYNPEFFHLIAESLDEGDLMRTTVGLNYRQIADLADAVHAARCGIL